MGRQPFLARFRGDHQCFFKTVKLCNYAVFAAKRRKNYTVKLHVFAAEGGEKFYTVKLHVFAAEGGENFYYTVKLHVFAAEGGEFFYYTVNYTFSPPKAAKNYTVKLHVFAAEGGGKNYTVSENLKKKHW